MKTLEEPPPSTIFIVLADQVTPELVRLYQEAVKAMEASRNGYGQGSNFYGVRDPYLAYNDCLQAPSRPR